METKEPAIDGELIAETFDFDGGRQITAYIPPEPAKSIVFAGDGQRIARWGGDLETAGLRSTMIVGVHGLAEEMPRLCEYTAGVRPREIRRPREVLR